MRMEGETDREIGAKKRGDVMSSHHGAGNEDGGHSVATVFQMNLVLTEG